MAKKKLRKVSDEHKDTALVKLETLREELLSYQNYIKLIEMDIKEIEEELVKLDPPIID